MATLDQDDLNAIAAAVWDRLTSALVTAGSIGKLIVDNLNAAVSSRLAAASYTAPLDAAGIRTAIGLSSANIEAQLGILYQAGLVHALHLRAVDATRADMAATFTGTLTPLAVLKIHLMPFATGAAWGTPIELGQLTAGGFTPAAGEITNQYGMLYLESLGEGDIGAGRLTFTYRSDMSVNPVVLTVDVPDMHACTTCAFLADGTPFGLTEYQGAFLMSRTRATLGTPAGASLAADIAAIEGGGATPTEIWTHADRTLTAATAGRTIFTWTEYEVDGVTPVPDVRVDVFANAAGTGNPITSPVTDELGQIKPSLDPGTYYLFRSKAGRTFANPATILVS